ncbi:MAG: DMT family transporter [Gemmatimonadales bacterium]
MPPLALVALLCFAANSVLARLALRGSDGGTAIDAASFTAIRLAAGAIFLALLVRTWRAAPAYSNPHTAAAEPPSAERRVPSAPTAQPSSRPAAGIGALLLFLYAAPFSFAYLALTTATGALILFGAVQVTMIGSGLFSGERPHAREWLGLAIALGGLGYLNLPGLAAPPLGSAMLMGTAGVAWGFYSLRGRGTSRPLADTTSSFVLAAPLGLLLLGVALAVSAAHASPNGIAAAATSGALASGGGYAAWYAALPRLSATRAGTIQLAVPVLAALAGTVILGEPVSLRLVISGAVILGGIGLAISARK